MRLPGQLHWHQARQIQNWLLEQAEQREWSPATRNRYQAAFSLVFRVGIDYEKLTVNPASRIKRKPEHKDRIRFLSAAEETKLTKAILENWPHYLPAFLFSIHTGLRASEQWGLDWSAVSLAGKTVTLPKKQLRSGRDWFEPAIEMAGLKNYTWHCHRHTFASNLVMASVDLRTVAQLLGHATIAMTMRFSHLAPEHTQAAVERLVR